MAPFSVVEDLGVFEQADVGGLVVEPAFVVSQRCGQFCFRRRAMS